MPVTPEKIAIPTGMMDIDLPGMTNAATATIAEAETVDASAVADGEVEVTAEPEAEGALEGTGEGLDSAPAAGLVLLLPIDMVHDCTSCTISPSGVSVTTQVSVIGPAEVWTTFVVVIVVGAASAADAEAEASTDASWRRTAGTALAEPSHKKTRLIQTSRYDLDKQSIVTEIQSRFEEMLADAKKDDE